MNSGRTVFAQLIEYLSHKEFQRCVARYGGDRYAKKLSGWEQFLAMAFAQLTYRESLRDIEACLGAVGSKFYHMGFAATVARSTLADTNENRDWRVFADFAQVLLGIAGRSMPANRWASIWIKACMRWTRRLSISAWNSFPGPSCASIRLPSRCTRYWTCAATSRPSSGSRTARCMASPAFTGTPSAPTQTTGDNTTALATDVFVNASITAGGFLTTSSASSTYAPKASPTFTGTVTVPTETIVSSGNMHLDAAAGAYYVCINCDNNTGTSGFVVQNGTGSSPTTEFQVTGSGNTTATGYLSSKGWFGNYTASYTAGAAAGTSPTIACATTHTCTNIQGTYSIKTGTSPTTGTLVTINLNHTQNNILDCSSDLWLPGTGHILTYELTNSTTSTIVVTLDAALTASTTYYFTYVCGSY
jgi:hypothetical protein